MTDKPVYQMSMVGNCPKTLAAWRLGYDPTPIPPEELAQLNHYSRLEAIAAQQIMDLGFRVEPSSKCQTCLEQYGNEQYGMHVEIELPLYLLVGHLDRRLILNGKKYPIEIKSLGKSSWLRFQKEQFNAFTSYAGQECAYLEAEKAPGIYWVMERNSGKPQKYIVNDFNNELQLDGFERTTLPITFSEIEDKLNLVELSVQENLLPEGEETNDCWFCHFKYLCLKPETEEKDVKDETRSDLVEAAEQYKIGLDMEKQGKELKSEASLVLLTYSKQSQVSKFRTGGVSFTYQGFKEGKYFNTSLFKMHHPDLYEKYLESKKGYDDFDIRILGSRKEKK